MSAQPRARSARRIAVEGRSCWRRPRTGRAAFLVDAAGYFSAFAEAAERAERSIRIVGWDVHSRVSLRRDEPHRRSDELGAFLNELASRRPGLEVHILDWDFAMIFAFEREALPVFQLGWRTHEGVHFELDAAHPPGASHHQKIVVIDDAVAFAGGIDLTRARWDTREHLPDDPRRAEKSRAPHFPFHDVQMIVDGEAAAALGELVRERWERATGKDLGSGAPAPPGRDPWPPSVEPDLRDVRVAIARTEPAFRGREAVREVEALYRDSIAAARRHLYVECQYLTPAGIGDALEARLREPDGPEVVIVTNRECFGWLEQVTMDVVRARLLRRLRAADRHDRLRVYHAVTGGDRRVPVNLHAKVMIVDDVLARVGSSNLSNRSMGLDTECDLAIEAGGDPRVAGRIAAFRDGLLAEHLGVPVEKVTEAIAGTGSLAAAIELLAGGSRKLVLLDGEVEPWLDDVVPEAAIVDPERPLGAEAILDQFLPPEAFPEEAKASGWRRTARAGGLLAGVLALALAWRFTPLADWVQPDRLLDMAAPLRDHALAPVVTIAAFVIGGLLLVPVTALILVTALLFGPWLGTLYAVIGSLASAGIAYAAGSALWRDVVRRLSGRRLNRINAALARRGILAVAAVRLVPVAPFTVVNLVAGSSHIRFRDFALGTVIAMTPGIFGIAFFADRVAAAVRRPQPENLATAAAVLVALLLAAYGVRRWLGRGAEDGSGAQSASAR